MKGTAAVGNKQTIELQI